MYKKDDINKGTFKIELLNEYTQEQTNISVYAPKLKTLKKLELIGDIKANAVGQLTEIISELLSRNKEKIKISADFLENALDIEDMTQILEDYFGWIENIKKK